MPDQLSETHLQQTEQVSVATIADELPRVPPQPDEKHLSPTTRTVADLPGKRQAAIFWPTLGGLFILGLFILGVVTYSAANWFNSLQSNSSSAAQHPLPISSINVQRSASYSDLSFTLVSVQTAKSFSDDPISAGPMMVRTILHVANPTNSTIDLTYYDVARLLLPGKTPIVPTNLNLAATLLKGANQSGWIDFPVSNGSKLATLKLQLGSAATHELLVTIPVSGAYNPGQYTSHLFHEAVTIPYFFQGFEIPGYWLSYRLTSIAVSDAYNGAETSQGDQFYTLNFAVSNPNNVLVQPGYGYDYIRLGLGTNRPPIDNTLPYGFKPGAHNVTGHVTYSGPASLRSLLIVFLYQNVAGWQAQKVSL
jgi:hypothetical protein